MPAVTFDTHENVKKLTSVGFTEAQAQAETQTRIVTALIDQIDNTLATKQDLDERLKELEYRLIIRLGGMIVVANTISIGIVATLVKIL